VQAKVLRRIVEMLAKIGKSVENRNFTQKSKYWPTIEISAKKLKFEQSELRKRNASKDEDMIYHVVWVK